MKNQKIETSGLKNYELAFNFFLREEVAVQMVETLARQGYEFAQFLLGKEFEENITSSFKKDLPNFQYSEVVPTLEQLKNLARIQGYNIPDPYGTEKFHFKFKDALNFLLLSVQVEDLETWWTAMLFDLAEHYGYMGYLIGEAVAFLIEHRMIEIPDPVQFLGNYKKSYQQCAYQ